MEKIKKLRNLFNYYNLDGYIVAKNDEFFCEYVPSNKDRLKYISNFSGSFGYALILKDKNYLFVDGRYTLQAKIQTGASFNIITIPNKLPANILKNKKLKIGFDPKLYTRKTLNFFFKKTKCKPISIKINLVDKIWQNKKKLRLANFMYCQMKKPGKTVNLK